MPVSRKNSGANCWAQTSRVIVGRPSGSNLPSDDGISDHILALDVVRGEHCVSYHIEAFHVLERTPISNEFNRSRDRE